MGFMCGSIDLNDKENLKHHNSKCLQKAKHCSVWESHISFCADSKEMRIKKYDENNVRQEDERNT